MKRFVGEIVILVVAIAVVIGVAAIVLPGDLPDPDSATYIAEKQRHYNRLFLATIIPLPAGIVAYWLLQKQYRRYHARNGATTPTVG